VHECRLRDHTETCRQLRSVIGVKAIRDDIDRFTVGQLDGCSRPRRVCLVAGKLTTFGTFGGQPSTARSINNRGQALGTSLLGIGRSRPFVWQDGRITALPTLGGKTTVPFTSVSAVNNRGQIVGSNSVDLVMWTREGGR
jgi:probable HAF family extracellular repeat protein